MGWGHEDREVLTDSEVLSLFSLEKIGKSKAQFAQDKLEHYNQAHMAMLPPDIVLDFTQPFLKPFSSEERAQALRLLPEVMKRSKTLIDVAGALSVLWPPRECVENVSAEQRYKVLDVLAQCAQWSAEALEQSFRVFAEKNSCKLVHFAQPLRILLTGKKVSPPVFLLMEVLGKETVLKRVKSGA